MIVGLLCLAAVLFVAAGLIWWGSFYRSSVSQGNDADKLAAQFNSDWPTFVGKPEGSSTQRDAYLELAQDSLVRHAKANENWHGMIKGNPDR